jgi:hypothetical protein
MSDVDADDVPETVAEAKYLLRVAHTHRTICQTQKLLAQLQFKETRFRLKLYNIRIDKANRKLDKADEVVGNVRDKVSQSGHLDAFKSLYKQKSREVRKFGSESLSRFPAVSVNARIHTVVAMAGIVDSRFVKVPGGGILSVDLD